MKKQTRFILALALLWMGMLACAIPGQTTASPSAPTIAPGQLETAVAEKVSAALAQTEQAVIPSPTIRPTVTKAPPTPTPIAQSSITQQEDGTTLFVDDKAGFQITLPPGWLPVRNDQPEYLDAFSLSEAASPLVQTALTDIQELDPNVFRLFVFDLQDGHILNGFVTNIRFFIDPEQTLTLDTEGAIREIYTSLPNAPSDATIKSASTFTTLNEIPAGIVELEMPHNTDEANTTLYQKQVYLNLREGSLFIVFTTEINLKDATLPFFDTMVGTIRTFAE
jgi:hypothetical protein